MDEIDLSNFSLEDLESTLNNWEADQGPSTDAPVESETTEEPSTEGRQKYIPLGEEGFTPRPGVVGAVQDIAQSTMVGMPKNLYEGVAPAVGLIDTATDAYNMATGFNVPKLPEYEDNVSQAVRNISGLVIPSLGLRSMAIQGASKIHAAGKAAPWLQKLGNTKSFEYFAKFGIDIGTSGAVDYVAEQNQKDDNLAGTLKSFWPKTFQWIPNSIATDEDDSAGEKRAKNVNEGAIFGVLSNIVEGAAYLTKAGRSVKRTSKFIPSKENGVKNINELTKDEFTDIKFSDNPVEDEVLRGYARKE